MASPADEPRRNWLELPREVTASILSRLTAKETLTSAQYVCKSWLEISKDPLVWNRIDMINLGRRKVDMDKMCRHAVDRSCGQAVDVKLHGDTDDDLLQYIADRSSRIKRLRLFDFGHLQISDEGLIKAVEKLPALEDLQLTFCRFACETLEAVGRKCPCLRAVKLKWSHKWGLPQPEYKINEELEDYFNNEAFAIGKSMSGLKRLKLIGNPMTNKGLGAILDGCPNLESLELHTCFHVRTEGNVWERCVERVKHLVSHDDHHIIIDGNVLSFGKKVK